MDGERFPKQGRVIYVLALMEYHYIRPHLAHIHTFPHIVSHLGAFLSESCLYIIFLLGRF